MPARRFEDWGPLVLVLLAMLLVRGGALAMPFFADDFLFLDLVRNHPGLAAIAAPDPIGNFFRPLARAGYFGVLAPLTGESSVAFHVLNLTWFALALGLFLKLVRIVLARGSVPPTAARLGGMAGTAFLALHYAFDVPVMWASGSQDLLAIVGALGALVLVLEGQGAWAAAVLALALLSKEAVAPCAAIAVALGLAVGDSWPRALRRAAPLFLATALWAAAWWAVRASGGTAASPLGFGVGFVAAALAHAAQVALGLEFRDSGPPILEASSLLATVLVVLATFWVSRRQDHARGKVREAPRVSGSAIQAGLAWALLASLPVVLVAPIWSAYFYGFALFGWALALAGWIARLPERRRAFAPALVGALGLMSAQARAIDGFGVRTGEWSAQSHLNRHYFARAKGLLSPLIRDLKAAHPTMPHGSTLYFANLPSFSGFQVGDGPLVRWAYHDPTLKSHFLGDFSAASASGPVFVFGYDGSRLVEETGPTLFVDLGSALVEGERLVPARDAFRLAVEREPEWAELARQWLPWLDRALATGAAGSLPRASPDPAVQAALRSARTALAAGDSAAAFRVLSEVANRAGEDPMPHALLADLAANTPRRHAYAVFQAFIARTLAPGDPESWRRWALLVAASRRDEPALAAIGRWRALVGPAAAADPVMTRLEAEIRARLPGGAVAREAIRQR